jgi:hypothetical protein
VATATDAQAQRCGARPEGVKRLQQRPVPGVDYPVRSPALAAVSLRGGTQPVAGGHVSGESTRRDSRHDRRPRLLSAARAAECAAQRLDPPRHPATKQFGNFWQGTVSEH